MLIEFGQDKEVSKEAATARLAAGRLNKQGGLRIEVLQRGR